MTHVTLATAIDKNRFSSDEVYLLLLEVDITDPTTGSVLETVYCTNNNENYTWNGILYKSIPFEVELTQDKDTTPSATLTVYDFSQTIVAALTSDGWSMSWPARFKVINASNPSSTPDLEQDFRLLDATVGSDKYTVNFTVGSENPLALRFPIRQQFRNRCQWGYKSAQCKYAGSMGSCDYTLDGSNGCIAHANAINFGGFPGVEHSIT